MKTFDDRKKSVEEHITKIKRKRRRTLVTVTSLALVLSLVLFVPYNTTPPSVRQYADSEYYGLIQQLNALAYQPPEYKNNFHAMIGFLSDLGPRLEFTGGLKGEGVVPMPDANPPMYDAPTMPNASPGIDGDQYVEVTDNQVNGVTEADIIKRTEKFVYYLRDKTLFVYSIEQENSHLVGAHTISWWNDLSGIYGAEMYLSADCTTITILAEAYDKTQGAITQILNLDVTDPGDIREIGCVYFVGSYLTSRVVDGDLLLTYHYGFRLADVDFDDPATFVPQYGTPGNMSCIPGNSIVCPDDVSSARYTVVCKLDGKNLEVLGTAALLGYSQELYVSADTIYATRSFTEKQPAAAANQYRRATMTEITGICYSGEKLEVVGTIVLEGAVKNQYSMDAFEGVLRVVTSTTVNYLTESVFGEFTSVSSSSTERNVNLYCIDLSNWEVAAEVIAFAPEGEDAQSVRFDGVNAYVCTAEVITFQDPVYFFDLSDLTNITWTDTGTIDGYSTSLIQLGDGYLLGVGYSERQNLKIEIYEEYDGNVVSVCSYERNAIFSIDYKSYLIDRENGLFGLEINDLTTCESEYVLLQFDGYQLHEILRLPVEKCYDMSSTRAFLADGWLYILRYSTEKILAQKIL